MAIKCEHCGKEVLPVKKQPKLWVLALCIVLSLFMFGVPMLLFLLNWILKPMVCCPCCGNNVYRMDIKKEVQKNDWEKQNLK